jgi:hypothetical protein
MRFALLTLCLLPLAGCFDNPRTPADYALIRQHAALDRGGIDYVSGAPEHRFCGEAALPVGMPAP